MTASISPDRPPYLTLTISQALSLPPPPVPEPAQHVSVNAMLDARAREMPDQLATGFTFLDAKSEWQCHTLTYAQVRALSIQLARELRDKLPDREANAKSPNRTPLVAVLPPSGVQLFGHIVALWRLGYGVLCIAPGSPAESIANLLRLTETRVILAHASQAGAAQAAVEVAVRDGREKDARVQVCEMVPNVLDYAGKSVDDKAETETDLAGADDVLVTMHTSGSSGLPKPIYQLHRFWTASMLSAPGRDLSAFTTTPLFHGGMSDLLRSIQAGSSIFFHPTADPGALATSAICQAVTACGRTISYFLSVPYILDMLFTDRTDDGRRMLASMELVSTGGAALPQQLGDAMVQHGIRLVSRLGSSECGFLMSSWRDFASDAEWNFLHIPDALGQSMLRFEPHDGRLFELVVTQDWPTKLVANREDGSYATSDLYSRHDTLPNTWRYESRADDTIVLVSGKKATAPLAEQKLKASPLVSEAIVFGANRAILGALVFASPDAVPEGAPFDDQRKIELLQQLQPLLKQINAASPPHAQLATEMIHLLSPSELPSVPRASKGTLQRGRAYQHYADLIDSVYVDFEEGRSLHLEQNGGARKTLEGAELIAWLQDKVHSINGAKLEPDTDLFVAGVDSIQSARIRAAIHQGVELGGRLLERNVVYEYPTLRLLTQHIEEVRAGNDGSAAGDERQQRELSLMRVLVDKYSDAELSHDVSPSADRAGRLERKKGAGTLFVLTGVTGGLGAQLLDQVLAHSQSRDAVVCLVRGKTQEHAKQRVLDSLEHRRLDAAFALVQDKDSRVNCLPADLSRPDCGLDIESLVSRTNHHNLVTIHSAWSVNFVAGLSSFEAENIAGLSHLMSLHEVLLSACVSPGTSCFTFCSSVASVLGRPEAAVLDERLSSAPEDAVPMGYARSKWVAEQIVARRSRPSSRYAVVRIGQLCSDTAHGVWNESEAWPILLQLSQQLECFPDLAQERLHWLSTDIAARAVLDLSTLTVQPAGQADVYNLAQPISTSCCTDAASWTDLHSWLASSGLPLALVRPTDWLDKVQKSDANHRGLLPLWQKNFTSPSDSSDIRFDCTKALGASTSFRHWQEQGVTEALVRKTVQRWKEIGFLR